MLRTRRIIRSTRSSDAALDTRTAHPFGEHSSMPTRGPDVGHPAPQFLKQHQFATSCYLPVPPTSLIGRAEEARTLHALLQGPDVRLLTLTGTAGVGKT